MMFQCGLYERARAITCPKMWYQHTSGGDRQRQAKKRISNFPFFDVDTHNVRLSKRKVAQKNDLCLFVGLQNLFDPTGDEHVSTEASLVAEASNHSELFPFLPWQLGKTKLGRYLPFGRFPMLAHFVDASDYSIPWIIKEK